MLVHAQAFHSAIAPFCYVNFPFILFFKFQFLFRVVMCIRTHVSLLSYGLRVLTLVGHRAIIQNQYVLVYNNKYSYILVAVCKYLWRL